MKKTVAFLTAICSLACTCVAGTVPTASAASTGKYVAILDKDTGTKAVEYANKLIGDDFITEQGNKSDDILNSVNTNESWQSAIKTADTVYVSVGYSDIVEPVLNAIGEDKYNDLADAAKKFDVSKAQNAYAELVKIGNSYSDNVVSITDEIAELNPNAKIVVETIYNPLNFYGVEKYNIIYKTVNTQINKFTGMLSARIKSAAQENPNIKIADTESLFAGKSNIYTSILDMKSDANAIGNTLRAEEIANAVGVTPQGTQEEISQDFKSTPIYTIAELRKNKLDAEIDKYLDDSSKRVIGDLNDDGKTDASDATLALIDYATVLNGDKSKLGDYYADLDNDGRVTSADATKMLIFYANKLQDNSFDINAYIISDFNK